MQQKNTQPHRAQQLTVTLDEPMYDKQDILQLFHISERTLVKWRKNKVLPYYRIGKKIYYPKKLVEAHLEQYRVQ